MKSIIQKTGKWLSDLFTRASLSIAGLGLGWLLGLSISPVVSIVITSMIGAATAIIAAKSGLENKPSGLITANEQPTAVSSTRIDPRPLAALIISIFLGSIAGIWARTHNLLGTDLSMQLDTWAVTGLEEQTIARRLFEIEHPYTPYAEELSWMKLDPTSGVTATLAAEVEMWTQLGLPQDEVARRLFEIKYPTNRNFVSSTSPFTATVSSAESSKSTQTVLYLSPEDQQKCSDLLRYSYDADADGVSDFREQVLEKPGIELFQKLATVILDDEMLYGTLEILCEEI